VSGSEPADDVEKEWARLREQLQLAERFWLGFVFSASPQAVATLRRRAEEALSERGRSLVLWSAEQPQALMDALPWLLQSHVPEAAGCTWVEAIRSDSPGAPEQPWRRAWERFYLRANERRDALRSRLAGGLVFAAPPEIKPLLREAAPDLWSVRSLVIDLEIQATAPLRSLQGPPARSYTMMPPEDLASARSRLDIRKQPALTPERAFLPSPSTLPPAPLPWGSLSVTEKPTAAELAALGGGQMLLQAAIGHLAEGRIDEARKASARACELLRGKDVLAETRALSILSEAEAASGAIAAASVHIAEAIAARRAVSPEETPIEWIALAGRLAREQGDYPRAADVYAEAESACRRRLGTKETLEALNDLLVAVTGTGRVRLLAGDFAGAATAFDEGVVVARRIRDLSGDSTESLRNLAGALANLGDVRCERGDFAGATAAVEESVTLARRVCTLAGELPVAQRDLSSCLVRSGRLQRKTGDLGGAKRALLEALAIRRGIISAGDTPLALRTLASCLHHLGRVEHDLGEATAAAVAFEEALSLDRRRQELLPDSPEVVHDLAISLYQVGEVRRGAGDPAGACAMFQECVDVASRLALAHPRRRPMVATALRALSEAKRAAGQEAEAADESLKALSEETADR
jgi:tetratricopeptide (TPR) repeat protein